MTLTRSILVFILLPGLFLVASSPLLAQVVSPTLYSTQDGLAGDFITAIAFGTDGSAWIGTTQGATHISNDGWVSYTRAHGLGDSWITAVAAAPDGRVWFGTASGGAAVLDPRARTLTTFNRDNSSIPSNFVTALAVDARNHVWLGTLDAGLAEYDPVSGIWRAADLPVRAVTTLALDEHDQPLVGTTQGAFRRNGAEWEADRSVGAQRVRRIDSFDGNRFLTAGSARYLYRDGVWQANDGEDALTGVLKEARLEDGQLTAFARDNEARDWLGTPRGLVLVHRGTALTSPRPLPVVLIHGWTVAGDDTLETSEFRFLAAYARRDGIPVYYARGVSPRNTLYQNAQVVRDEIARVKKESGARQVNLIGFSMGGMNTRAYLESSFYAGDVNRAIILGTPQAGVEVWKPILTQQILAKPDEPSAVELSPEYAALVDETRAPNPGVPYDLLIGDARKQNGLDFLEDMPASDALISVHSALALDGPQVRGHVNADLHDIGPQAVPLPLTGYLYPRDTWERYLRNALRNPGNLPLGAEIQSAPPEPGPEPISNHTPVVTAAIAPGATVTRTVTVDANKSARFIAYYPGGEVELKLVGPDGKTFTQSVLPREDSSGVLSLSTDLASFSGYVVPDATAGIWQLVLTRKDAGRNALDVSSYVELDAPRQLHVRTDPVVQLGATTVITAFVASAAEGANPAQPDPGARDVKVSARIARPDGHGAAYTMEDLELFDDGAHADGAANDGYFANTLTPDRAGWHVLFVDAAEDGFTRESEQLIAVSPGGAQFDGPARVEGAAGEVRVAVPVRVERAGDYLLSVHGLPAFGSPFGLVTPVTLQAGENTVPLALPAANFKPGVAYRLDLMLLDASWAAVPLAAQAQALTVTR